MGNTTMNKKEEKKLRICDLNSWIGMVYTSYIETMDLGQ